MQASQSNKASDLLNPETQSGRQPNPALTKGLPSAFSAPIQAARKYLERQRGDAWESGAAEAELARHGALPHRDGPPVRERAGWEQDLRLQSGLYEGHSIEAGLNFEASPDGDPQAGDGLAYLAESDGAESSFLYAMPGPMPDPDAVRGAISRLARESELRRATMRGAEECPGWGPPAAKASGLTSLDVETARPLNFGDVALRVWGADAASSGTSPAGLESGIAAPAEEIVTQAQSETGEVRAAVLPNRPVTAGCVVERGPALAHDACNLLSGLALYSELLASPGVLDERYRHYAEELKLIAARSQALIDRLFRVAASRQEQVSRPDGQAGTVAAGEAIAAVRSSQADLGDGTASATLGAESSPLGDATVSRSRAQNAIAALPMERPHTAVLNGRPEATSLVDLLMHWGGLLSTLAHGNLEVVFGPHASIPVAVEAEALERILVNLVRNARAATVQGGAVRIGVGSVDGVTLGEDVETPGGTASGHDGMRVQGLADSSVRMIALTVDDSGCGMTEAQVRRALGEETGSEAAAAPTGAEGERGPRHGLGLRIVRELVAASGGTFSVQSCVGRGTRMEIRWPVATATDASAGKQDGRPVEEAAEIAATAPEPVAPVPPAAPAETHTNTSGPDGFSEAELRAMMLQLHRGGPQERSPLSRRPSDRRGALPEAGRRFGLVSSGAEGSSGNRPSKVETETKGAIAC